MYELCFENVSPVPSWLLDAWMSRSYSTAVGLVSYFSKIKTRAKNICTGQTIYVRLAPLPGLESLNLREGQSRPGTGFGLGPPFWGMVWTHFALFSLKICGATKTKCC